METKTYIYGKHAVFEALSFAPQVVREVFLAKNFDDAELLPLIKKNGILLNQKMPNNIGNSAVHQGIVATVSFGSLMLDFREFADSLALTSDTSLVLLGELEDPQNVGAVIRSAVAFGLSGILIPEHNQAQLSGSVVKVSAGMAFKIPLVKIGNVNSAVRDLKRLGFFVYGLDGSAKHTITKEAFEAPSLFVLGNESVGIREKTRELCDKLLSIPINPKCQSLNAGTSASVAFYAWSAKHPKALRVEK